MFENRGWLKKTVIESYVTTEMIYVYIYNTDNHS